MWVYQTCHFMLLVSENYVFLYISNIYSLFICVYQVAMNQWRIYLRNIIRSESSKDARKKVLVSQGFPSFRNENIKWLLKKNLTKHRPLSFYKDCKSMPRVNLVTDRIQNFLFSWIFIYCMKVTHVHTLRKERKQAEIASSRKRISRTFLEHIHVFVNTMLMHVLCEEKWRRHSYTTYVNGLTTNASFTVFIQCIMHYQVKRIKHNCLRIIYTTS